MNLLRTEILNPKLSAQVALYGNVDFNKTPLAPPGTKEVIQEKPGKIKYWGPHGVEG